MAAEQKISSALEKELESMDKECIRPLQASINRILDSAKNE